MTARYSSTIPLARAPMFQVLVKRHGLWFSSSSIWQDRFTSTVCSDDMTRYNAFMMEWELTEQEFNANDEAAAYSKALRERAQRPGLWARVRNAVRAMWRDVR